MRLFNEENKRIVGCRILNNEELEKVLIAHGWTKRNKKEELEEFE